MKTADQDDDLGERGVRRKQVVMTGMHDVALDVVEYFTASLVDPANTRRAIKAQPL